MYEKTLENLARALGKFEIPYMVMGGQAVLIYGEPRFTSDIDVTLGVGAEDLKKLLSLCKKLGLKPMTKNPESFVSETMVLPARDPSTGLRVDFIFSFTPYEREAIRRTKKVKMGRQMVHFASPEDVILQKIFAGRPRDLEDVRGILLRGRRLDALYIARWLKEFDRTFPERKFSNIFKKIRKENKA